MKKFFAFATFLLLLCTQSAAADSREHERLKRSIVKIYTTAAAPDYFNPWALLNAKQLSGSGAVIKGKRILTNAHVVANGSFIQVQRHGDAQKFRAQVQFISHDADLALLTVDDNSFFEDTHPLTLGELPDLQEEVTVYGYPIGGKSLSITRGVLSRVEHQYYAHAESYLMAGQIDAAINPGNSGGPVISNGRIVGVAMQANHGAENLGYFVPPSVIRHVLEDAKDGVHQGFPELGAVTQSLESPAMKKAAGIGENQEGALIVKVFSDTPAADVFKPGDVLLEVDGYPVAADRTVEWRENQRTNYHYVVDQYHVGDKLPVRFARDGKVHSAEITLAAAPPSRSLVVREQFDQRPRYYIYGGVVFVPLNMNLIKRWGNNWHTKAPIDYLYARNQWNSEERRELVVALKVLPADVNLGYHDWKNWIIDSVNGHRISDFDEFAQLMENNTEPFVELRDQSGYRMVLDALAAREQEPLILQTYQIPHRHSQGLFSTLANKDE
ncbi:serine protease [Microbulbifer thermotolerans]|uniref:Serine protease n=1 Tax=Microbulbifer thermotolerans TaxID=252514 RepID=A0AB35HYS7_MICTH|nr:serine protease [Microbulbifer thermotolerans]MCX2780697.1 serine protease [Microbulbifer thermotolerans]MCX2783577.1 serine protease [Microbulbifer thermotolerans]MCX2795788.1 serine protease [Microbulbifer thermotolerans]MCX2801952.1 serine protease [Microbulbifer thermotolerans]MCX2806315.1 serine protease [Microbulbifer thermotolerans]